MSYSYEKEKPWLFTDEGSRALVATLKEVQNLLRTAGAFRWDKLKFTGVGSTWQMMALVDRLVELGEIEAFERSSWAQYKVYSSPQRT